MGLALFIAALVLSPGVMAHGSGLEGEDAEARVELFAPGYSELNYELPPAGSYALPPLGDAKDGQVLDSDGAAVRLHRYLGDRIVLLSFIYSSCGDVNGCPLATAVFHKIKQGVAHEPSLQDRLRLLSLSFNPARDTPQIMQAYGAGFREGGIDWRFLTTRSETELAPILAGYNQSLQKEYNEQGEITGNFSHILRVFLIDQAKRIRNIYSVSFLHADVLINDVKTLLLERNKPLLVAAASAATALSGPGDYKQGYESAGYRTRSAALANRRGKPADLLSLANNPPSGLPRLPVPDDNPLTESKIALGRKLFFDRRLSLNNTFSCAMCHVPEQGFASNELATAVGVEGRTVRRNTPTLYNVAYFKRLFHDGRENLLEQQVWGPLLANNEMANPSVGAVLEKIKRMPDYQGLFEGAFDGKGPTMSTLGMAIASYERTLVAADSPFDRWYYGQQQNTLSASAQRGLALFNGKARCAACHLIGPDHALLTDDRLHNTGVGYDQAMRREPEKRKVQLAPGVFADVETALFKAASEPRQSDLGLYEITQNPNDRWKYKTPSLRNVDLTPPYMHNGSLATLKEVVEFYNRGGVPNEVLDPLIAPLNLSEGQKDDLVAFLESLTGGNVDLLVADAFAAPIGDLRKQDLNWAHNRVEQ